MEEETKPPISPKKKGVFIVIAVVAIVALGAAGYFWWQASSLKDSPQVMAEKEARDLIAEVSQLIVLPEDEDPIIATVADPEQLSDTPFFENAKIGDKVLIYNKARKAILYDPQEHRILEVAPLNIGESQ